MEGYAIIAALKDAAGQPCKIHTDSELWIKIITEWSNKWKANGWQKKGGIKNIDIVKEVCELYRSSKAELIWVRGHNSDQGNELADEYANAAREQRSS
jgi:ribonuclease HI